MAASPKTQAPEYDALIIGAGISGLYQLYRLRELGMRVRVLEAGTGVGDWQVISYGSTLHGFTNPAADGSLPPSALYHERSDRRSWAAMQAFLAEVFGNDAATRR